jgi:hypothetical protein
MDVEINAQERYAQLETDREPYVSRAREAAALTLPFVMPDESFTGTSDVTNPYQALGARGVRVLASKLLLVLFPTNTGFFRYMVDDATREAMGQSEGDFETALAAREKEVMSEVEYSIFRPNAYSALTALLITGNYLIHVPKEGRTKGYRLDQYVVKRDPTGKLLEIVVKELVSPRALTEEQKTVLDDSGEADGASDAASLELYTHIQRAENKTDWVVYQAIGENMIPGSDGTYKEKDLEFIPLRISSLPGEDYGRSYVEEYMGDLDSLEALTEVLVKGSAAMAKIVFGVDPNGLTDPRKFARAETGDTIVGRASDVTAYQVQKQADLRVAAEMAQNIEQRLSYAFLLNSSVQRSGERVTAHEIRYMAADLDDALGGMYTLLTAEFQLPVVRLFERRMENRLKEPTLPDTVKPIIVAGLEGIGRGNDQRALSIFIADIVNSLTPEVAIRYLNPSELIKRAAASQGIDTADLIRTEEEIQQQEQQAQMMQMVNNLGPAAIGEGGALLQQQLQGAPANG